MEASWSALGPQERSQKRFETLFGRLWGSLGALLGGLGLLGGSRDAPGTALGPLGTHFTSILDSFETHVGSILDVLGAIFNKVS